ncbi:hypothetical protein K469DRAFT_712676 [Zopfia rhizophila CBS 207.26]|uniref:C2H2-type domain-containing protein n=1 Tax=Zopfia rhizophila CBS 207.26 TaxID=1314779 RepID=A0A6A6EVD1_9PEZI|nr:hypothetical protein K469DRAFT_712676 [Zopfia rhizophila CBS 207.26]
MVVSVLERCRACITTLKTIVSTLSDPDRQKGRVHHNQVNDELERFSLWMGNIGALHRPESSMSLESRLREADDVLIHILELLDDMNEVAGELMEIVSGEREGETASAPHDDGDDEDQSEETELLEEFGVCVTRLFRVSGLIRQAAPTDLFAKALSLNRYRFNDQFDIAHVGEKYPKLATEELAWLQKRLGRAITQRRHYLSYIQDHHEKLEGMLTHEGTPEPVAPKSQAPTKHLLAMKLLPDSSSQPSTFFTKASSLTPGHITPQVLAVEKESDPENDARSYTAISRSIDGDLDSSTTIRIPKLDELRTGSKKEVECPFCFRMKRFKNERLWRRHVFSDLRSYVCTFPDCDAPYFRDINEWFRHEMQSHRVSYTCRFCQSKTFQLKERYLAHVRKQHPDIIKDGEEQPVLDIARKPLDQIPAHECPCCSEWVDRIKERAAVPSMPSDVSNHILSVIPTVFKRHLASHLEQLALFAIPIGSTIEGDVDSNVAIEQEVRDESVRTLEAKEVFIAVMGQTGAGKSSFINWVTGANLVEGESLSSCTQEVQSASTIIDGRTVTLIDTPGFDDSSRSDGEILNLIATYLRHSYNRNELLSGVIYLHRITDNRIGHTGRRTMTVLQRMCGADNFQNIALVTTMWDKLVDPKDGERHEKELETKGEFWAHMISKKAKVSRHYGKKETALKIVKQIIPKPPVPLTIQAELSLESANVAGTAAGKVITGYLLEQKKHIQENHEFIRLPIAPEKMTERIDQDISYMKIPIEDLLAQAREAQTESKDGGATVTGGVTEDKGAAETSNKLPSRRTFLGNLIDMIRWMDLKYSQPRL